MHRDLDLWPFDLKIYRAHPWLMGSLHVKFHDDRCKGKAVMRRKPFSVIYALWLWPFDLKIYRAHPCLMGSLHVKFHDDRCKGKAVMRRKQFSVIYALWPWPLDLKIYRAHPCLMGSLHVKFHDDRCKGKAVMRRKPKCDRTDGRTWWFQYTPLTSLDKNTERLNFQDFNICPNILHVDANADARGGGIAIALLP